MSGGASSEWRGPEGARIMKKLVLLSMPLAILGIAIAIVDPFGFLRIASPIPESVKHDVAAARDPALWALTRFDEAPSGAVLLGDSRMANLSVSRIRLASGEPFAMLAFGGADLKEMVHAFWLAADRTKLTTVVMSVGFSQYAMPEPVDRVETFEAWKGNWLLYLINRTVLRSFIAIVATTGHVTPAVRVGRPEMESSAFWDAQLEYYGDRVMTGYSAHDADRQLLQEVATFCREHGITLRFVIMPTSAELHDRVALYGREAEYGEFERFLQGLAPTLNLDDDREFSAQSANFTDPVHVAPAERERVIRAIWPS